MSLRGDWRNAYWQGYSSAADPRAVNPYATTDETSPNFRLSQMWARGRATRIAELIGPDNERA